MVIRKIGHFGIWSFFILLLLKLFEYVGFKSII